MKKVINTLFPYRDFLYIFQLEEYDVERFVNWLKGGWRKRNLEQKKNLVWTKKAFVIFVISLILALITILGFIIWGIHFGLGIPLLLITPLLIAVGIGQFFFFYIILASVFLMPFEQLAKNFLVLLAKLKIMHLKNLKVVAITGSFGKTSTKEILYSLLSYKYTVLKTPKSYNTPLGIANIILKNLNEKHEFFIAELGAYKIGDIRSLTSLVKPKIGILTAIGKQHLERFKTIEAITNTKAELLYSLSENGIGIVNADNPYCRVVSSKVARPIILYSLTNQSNADIWATDFRFSEKGTTFIIHSKLPTNTFERELTVNLLGTQNVSNVLAAIACALSCEMTIDEIEKATKRINPIEHRLQPLKGASGTTILDDAYNSNPDSARSALEVLKAYPGNQKIVITPGLVELGKEQYKENVVLGQEMAKVANWVFIVGIVNSQALLEGLKMERFPQSNIFPVKNLNEATRGLQIVVKPKDVILFENDLPDQYQS